jgi:hypothetical protein
VVMRCAKRAIGPPTPPHPTPLGRRPARQLRRRGVHRRFDGDGIQAPIRGTPGHGSDGLREPQNFGRLDPKVSGEPVLDPSSVTANTRSPQASQPADHGRCGQASALHDKVAKILPRSRRAATLLYEATRATTRQPSCAGGMPCYARVCGGGHGGDPWMACKGSDDRDSGIRRVAWEAKGRPGVLIEDVRAGVRRPAGSRGRK